MVFTLIAVECALWIGSVTMLQRCGNSQMVVMVFKGVGIECKGPIVGNTPLLLIV